MKKRLLAAALCIVLAVAIGGCNSNDDSAGTPSDSDAPEKIGGQLIIASTTSTEDSGLFDYLLPYFTEDTGVEVSVVAKGTGAAIQMGRDEEADLLLVHDTASEEKFVQEGYAKARYNVMYNDFILVASPADPAGVKGSAAADIVAAFTLINDQKAAFVSRGDDSGTHKKELALWETAGITPGGDWYIEAGQGMGDVLRMADEMLGYTLTDRATYLSMKDNLDLEIVTEGDTNLFNQYGVLVVETAVNKEQAEAFQEWILSDKAQELIGKFGVDEFGEPLFIPNAE